MELTNEELFRTFRNKNILITGHTGFKGSWLSIWLTLLEANVTGFALDPYSGKDNFVVSDVSKHITDIRGDIRNYSSLEEVFEKYSPEIVFHLAAQPIVLEGYKNPKDTFDTNVAGTVNVLENCRKSDSVKAVINVTSDKCYENKEWIWGYRENDNMGGYDPYSSSKGCSELITQSYRQSFFNPEKFNEHGKSLSSARAGNVIGGGDWANDRIIPDCIRALEKNQPINIRNPYATRPWQLVLEALSGYLMLAANMLHSPERFNGPWNFGPEYSSIVPVKNLADLIIKNYGHGCWESPATEGQFHEARLLSLDISKAYFKLGWKPTLSFEETVQFTVEWYKSALSDKDMFKVCKGQIEKFMEKMTTRE